MKVIFLKDLKKQGKKNDSGNGKKRSSENRILLSIYKKQKEREKYEIFVCI